MKRLADPLLWLVALFLILLVGLPHSQTLFSSLFPELPRPVYQQESFTALALAHFTLVAARQSKRDTLTTNIGSRL